MAWLADYDSLMDMKQVLADNLNRLMEHKYGKDNQSALQRDAKVSQATIGRIMRMEVSAGIINIAKLARAFGLSPWQLTVPDLDPTSPPVLRKLNATEEEMYRKMKQAAIEIVNLEKTEQ